MTTRPRRVVWIYDGPHRGHPFIRQSIESMLARGLDVAVLDRSRKDGMAGDARYLHRPLGWLLPHLSDGGEGKASTNSAPAPSAPSISGSPKLRLRAGTAFLRGVTSTTFRSQVKDACFLAAALAHALALRPSIIVATLPTAATVGWIVARLLGARLVYYPFELFGEKHFQDASIWKTMEVRLLRRGVDAVITQNEARAGIYRRERGARVPPTIVHNYKRFREVAAAGSLRSAPGIRPEARIALYEGHLIPGRWLAELARSAEYLPDDAQLVFLGAKTPWWHEAVEPILRSPALDGRVVTLPWVEHADLLSYVASADLGIVIYDDGARNNYYCEPGKLSDYVLAGVPVVGPDFPTLGPVIRRYGIGTTFPSPDPRALAAAMTEVLACPKSTWAQALANARRDLVWETQEPAFFAALLGPSARSDT